MKYSIYQIKDPETCEYMFKDFNSKTFDFTDYKCVYNGELDLPAKYIDDYIINNALQYIFTTFNIMIPRDFKGHSLSVSDVVCLTDKTPMYYYCNTKAWKKIPFDIILK